MKVRIIETEEFETLSIVNPEIGEDWTEDFLFEIFDAGTEIRWNYDEEIYIAYKKDFLYWQALINKFQIADDRLWKKRQETKDRSALDDYLDQHLCGPGDKIPEIIHACLDAWEALLNKK